MGDSQIYTDELFRSSQMLGQKEALANWYYIFGLIIKPILRN